MSLSEHLEKLRHFCKLTDYNSINEAAQGMGMSQAGLSKSLAALENALDAKLFVRSKDGLVLTKEGQLVLGATKKILNEAATLEANLRSLRTSKIPERVRVGMYDSVSVYLFPDLVSYLKVIYPSVEIELLVDKSINLAVAVENGSVDIAVGVNLRERQSSKAQFFMLFEDHYSFYCASKVVAEVSKLPLIIHPTATDETGRSNEDALSALMKNRNVHRAFNFETIKTLTTLGLGIGVLPTQVAKPLVRQNLLINTKLLKTQSLFGKHSIGFLVSSSFLKRHEDFATDIYRLGQRWAKN